MHRDGRSLPIGRLTCDDRLLQERAHKVLEGSDAANVGRESVELLREARVVQVKELREGVEDTEGLRLRNHGALEENSELQETRRVSDCSPESEENTGN